MCYIPAYHATVIFQVVSNGNMMKVTTRSAMARCMMKRLTRDLRFLLRKSVMNTVKFPNAATEKRMLEQKNKKKLKTESILHHTRNRIEGLLTPATNINSKTGTI